MRAKLLAITLFLVVAPDARSQFTVFDPQNFAEAVKILTQDVQTYQQIVQLYQLGVSMAKTNPLMASQYAMVVLGIIQHSTASCPGCGVWTNSVNTGSLNADPNFGGAVRPLADYAAYMAMLDAEGQQNFRARLANGVYLPTATLNNTLSEIGRATATDKQVTRNIAQCNADATNVGLVSAIQVAQSTNGCLQAMAQGQTQTNTYLNALAQHKALEEARDIDAEKERLNSQIALQKMYQQAAADTGVINDAVDPITGR